MSSKPVITCPYCAKAGMRTVLDSSAGKKVECIVCRNVYWTDDLIRDQAQAGKA